jgi:hypothetical protein
MITFQQLGRYVTAEPFRPFRISMTSGQSFEIRHSEMISVGRSTARIYPFMSDHLDHATQRELEISLLLMESVEPLNATAIKEG